MQKKMFSYSPYFRIGNVLLSVFMIFLAGNIGYILFRITLSFLQGVEIQTDSLLGLSIIFFLMLVNVVIYLNWQPDFVLQDDGIRVKVYQFWERFIPWKDVIEVKHSWIPITGK